MEQKFEAEAIPDANKKKMKQKKPQDEVMLTRQTNETFQDIILFRQELARFNPVKYGREP